MDNFRFLTKNSNKTIQCKNKNFQLLPSRTGNIQCKGAGEKSFKFLANSSQKNVIMTASTSDRDGYDRRSWNTATKSAIYDRGETNHMVSLSNLVCGDYGRLNCREGKGVVYYHCSGCSLYYPQSGVHIDHKVEWRDWYIHREAHYGGVLTTSQQTTEYNNIENLQLLCSFCNGQKNSSDWRGTGWGYRDGLIGPRTQIPETITRQLG